MKRILFIGIAAMVMLASISYGQTISRQPYGFSTPYLYPMNATTQVVSSYYLALPTLTANDTAVGLAATQTFTNKTLTSPTITGPTITGTIAGTPTLTTPVIASFYQDAGKTQLMAAPNTASDTLCAIAAQQTLTNKTLTSPKIGTSILDVNGAIMFGFSPQTTAVNYLQFLNSPANTNLTINALGASTNISLSLNAKGSGGFNFQTQVATDDTIIIQPYVGGTAYFSGTITSVDLTTPAKVWTFPNLTGTVTLTTNKLNVFAATTSAELAGVISDEQGSGALVFANTPTLITPVLGAATATSVALGDGTAITKIVAYAPTLTPAATAAAIQTVEQTFTVTGLATTDKVFVNGPAPTSLCPCVTFRVSAADTLAIGFTTLTAVACTPVAGTYNIIAIRN